MTPKLNSAIAVIGIDIGKNSFHVVGRRFGIVTGGVRFRPVSDRTADIQDWQRWVNGLNRSRGREPGARPGQLSTPGAHPLSWQELSSRLQHWSVQPCVPRTNPLCPRV